MPSLLHVHPNKPIPFLGISAFPLLLPSTKSTTASFIRDPQILHRKEASLFLQNELNNTRSKKLVSFAPRCSGSTNSSDSKDQTKTPFGYTRKDVLLIGLGVTVAGVGLKSGLEFVGVDPLQAGNVVQLVMVLGLTVGWISTYIFRVSNKEMTYAQQLRDYEVKVMEKRLEGLTEAELEALLEQVEEEKQRQASGEQVN
ncbi:hypothetical protein ERO13_A09G174900v2 [Gossypium hirsutum]|uniref:Uncharacterized protein isoform X2 n=5 Tax=Gossypium TaxID=3633 RepID=A0ABM2YQR6_GOSHI|nr:uncharacterized protein LOC121203177 isoform X2 [Gossypium hirsutum]KAB2066791.1 hypothetical protein ES319_A09G183400v1 [Gossypium barbadense]TYH03274.1 hypothetical protein ES288_A09G206800v1 [Gossypium darwinii]TYI11351.1 hypothetical protein ES332_A09G202800v1 [Gossypium tomentosum]TYJ19370.1 hypothetical protein E1A91_A09G186600v1 [Gossypium mustelinum]KAG4184481.1 hypothetical protein ERO13_A09G174900v2 [Gossypium hirsutum]